MEYLLLATFLIGLLLFVLSWLRVIFAGFGHHFITGIVSAVPVVNLLVLPSLWHRVYGWVLAGIIGLLVAVGSWYSGADKHVYRHARDAGVNMTASDESMSTHGLDLNKDVASTSHILPNDENVPAAPLPSGKELPKTALYRMSYQEINVNSLGNYPGRYVRITRTDRKTFEGKLLSLYDKGIIIERRINGGVLEHKVNFNEITQAEVMSKQ